MQTDDLKWFHNQGLALIWLYKESKRPIGNDWNTGPRHTWDHLKKTFKDGHNVGVRTGTASKLVDGTYLHIVDVDVKSDNPEDAADAYALVKNFLGKDPKKCPQVISGRGGFSRHFYFKSDAPLISFNLFKSDKIVKVMMPSTVPSEHELKTLTEKEILRGLRLRPAFDVDVLGEGKQAVMPPSIHPDTRKPYRFLVPFADPKDLPLVKLKKVKELLPKKSSVSETLSLKPQKDWENKITEPYVKLIKNLEGLENHNNDRSAALFAAINILLKAGLSDGAIGTILLEPLYAISECIYDRVGNSLDKGWAWLRPQIAKVKGEGVGLKGFETDEATAIEDWGDFDDPEFVKKRGQESFNDVSGWQTELDKSQNGVVKANMKNTMLYLRHEAGAEKWLGFNELANADEFLGKPPWAYKDDTDDEWAGRAVSDSDVLECKSWLTRNFKFEPTTTILHEGFRVVSIKGKFHPVKNYLRSLEWDGVPRIDKWLIDYMGAEKSPYIKAVSKKFLLAAVNRVMRPGSKFDHALILEGEGGIGKSTMVRELSCGWVCDSLGDVTNKDVIGQIQGAWFVEVAELDSMHRAEVNAFKHFISRTEDKARLAYERKAAVYPRQCVLVGTTNDDEYLRDLTGNRRFWPVYVTKADFNGVKKIRDQLWAEAYHIWCKQKFTLWLDEPEIVQIWAAKIAEKLVTDEWDNVVRNWMENHGKNDGKKVDTVDTFYTLSAIWADCFGKNPGNFSKGEQMRLGGVMKRLGFERQKKREKVVWAKKVSTGSRGKVDTVDTYEF